MSTSKQERQFKDYVVENIISSNLPSSTLDDILYWVRDNVEPDQVFSEKQLEAWAEANGYIKE